MVAASAADACRNGGGVMTAPAVDAAAIPDLAEVAEVIDLQLVPPASVEVVLPRAHAQVLAVLLGDLLGREGGRR